MKNIQARRFRLFVLMVFCALTFYNCEKEFDKYYSEGPNDIGPPIIERLDEIPEFSKFHDLVVKVQMEEFFRKGPVYTMMVPTNDAIDAYNEANADMHTGIMDSAQIVQFINYHALYGIFYQYDFNKRYMFDNSNRYSSRWFDETYNQNKQVSVYPLGFFGASGNSDYSTDYESVYKSQSAKAYNTFNVEGARILPELVDMGCENGVIHGIDKVLEPAQNIFEFIQNSPQYSIYSEMVNRFDTLIYDPDNSYVVDGVEHEAYRKEFWYTDNDGNRVKFNFNYNGEDEDLTVFIPDNDALNEFFEPYLDNFGGEFSSLPNDLVIELLKYNVTSRSVHKERLFGQAMIGGIRMSDSRVVFGINNYINDNIVPLSNGLLYSVTPVLNPPKISRITGMFLLDQNFQSMKYVLDKGNWLNAIADNTYASNEFLHGERVRLPKSWTIIAPSNEVLTDSIVGGVESMTDINVRNLANFLIIPDTVYVRNPGDHIFEKGVFTKPFTDGYYRTASGTFMGKAGNRLISSLSPDSTATIVDEIYGSNGVIYVVDDALYNVRYNRTIVSELAGTNNIYTQRMATYHRELTDELNSYKGNITMLVPTDEAIKKYDDYARANGLPKFVPDYEGDTDVFTYEQYEAFLRNHVIRNRFMLRTNMNVVKYSSIGSPLQIYTEGGSIKVSGSSGDIEVATVESINTQLINGVINYIDRVLLPDLDGL